MSRSLTVALVLTVGVIARVVAAAAPDQPQETGAGEPDDPLAPPFLCVLPAGGTGDLNPEAYVRHALTAPNPGEELAIVTAPLGIRVARYPQQPAGEPKEDDWYAIHRQRVEPLLPLLKSLPSECLAPLCRGEIVVLTPYREALAAELAPLGFAATNELPPQVLASAVGVVAALTVSPIVEIAMEPGSHSLWSGTVSLRFVCDAQHYNFHGIQLDPGGSVAWEWKEALLARKGGEPSPWRVGSMNGALAAAPPDLPGAAGSDRDAKRATVRLSALSGRTVREVLSEALPTLPVAVALDDALAARRILARGDEVTWSAVVDAIMCSSWAHLQGPDKAGSWLLFSDRGQTLAPSWALRAEAREALDPEITAEIDAVLGSARDRPILRGLGVSADRFARRWKGPWADLGPEEAEWLADQLAAQASFGTKPSPLKTALGQWANEPDDLTVSTRYNFALLIGFCVPWSTPGPGALDITGVKPPPESYYSKLGAHTDLPMLSGRCARLTFY